MPHGECPAAGAGVLGCPNLPDSALGLADPGRGPYCHRPHRRLMLCGCPWLSSQALWAADLWKAGRGLPALKRAVPESAEQQDGGSQSHSRACWPDLFCTGCGDFWHHALLVP